MISIDTLAPEERISLELRGIYEACGYAKYRMGKFENYDLYAENRSFLSDCGIITFTDNKGRLLAMKPDVTLSIANGLPSGEPVSEKIYYCENVYRMPFGSSEYKEIMQLGVECIGSIDVCSLCEVISMAKKSLAAITDDYIMDISHIGLVSGIIAETGLDASDKEKLLGFINRKDAHDISKLCSDNCVPSIIEKCLIELTGIYAPIEKGIEEAEKIDVNAVTHSAIAELKSVYSTLKALGMEDKLYLDLSVADNVNYYDGIKFKGYVNGIFSPVLAGGSYGKLLKKLKKQAGAIGFAVYLDALSEYGLADLSDNTEILTYSSGDDAADVIRRAEKMRAEGKRVRVEKEASSC